MAAKQQQQQQGPNETKNGHGYKTIIWREIKPRFRYDSKSGVPLLSTVVDQYQKQYDEEPWCKKRSNAPGIEELPFLNIENAKDLKDWTDQFLQLVKTDPWANRKFYLRLPEWVHNPNITLEERKIWKSCFFNPLVHDLGIYAVPRGPKLDSNNTNVSLAMVRPVQK